MFTSRSGRRSFQKIELDEIPIGTLGFGNNSCSNCGGETVDRPVAEDPPISVQSESTTEKFRTGVKFIASVDIIYALLLIGLHLLTLITTNATNLNGPNRENKQSLGLGNGKVKYKKMYHPWGKESVYQNDTWTSASGSDDLHSAAELTTAKSHETVATMIWIGMFAICILELLVAGALYGGTKERDAKICIRNSRIWIYTAIFLNSISLFQFLGIFILGTQSSHVFRLVALGIEMICRLLGILLISKFIQLLKYELLDLGLDEHVLYYELLGPGVSSSLSPSHTFSRRR